MHSMFTNTVGAIEIPQYGLSPWIQLHLEEYHAFLKLATLGRSYTKFDANAHVYHVLRLG
jgi:hypothetical protein